MITFSSLKQDNDWTFYLLPFIMLNNWYDYVGLRIGWLFWEIEIGKKDDYPDEMPF